MKYALTRGPGTIVVQTMEKPFPVTAPFEWVECPDEVGADHYRYNGKSFDPVRRVPKSLILRRLRDAGQLEAAQSALAAADLYVRERWYAADLPTVHADDPEAIALLKQIGADPDVILAA